MSTLQLPVQKIKATHLSPRKLIIYSKPKVGKTSALAELPDSLILDLENGTDFLKIGNITYYNYALSTNDVINVFNNGPPTNSLIVEKKDNNSAAYLSAYNKIDIYNY